MWTPGELGKGLATSTAPRGLPRRAPTGVSGPLFSSFQKSYQSNQNVSHVRFQEHFVPSLMLLPSQRLASLMPLSLQSAPPTLEPAGPQESIVRGVGRG